MSVTIQLTSVVRIRRQNNQLVQGCDVYIGRSTQRGGWNLPQSLWHNPFSVNKLGREEALRQYEIYVRNNPLLMAQLGTLRGKVLGCWCKPEPCHGDILLKLLGGG